MGKDDEFWRVVAGGLRVDGQDAAATARAKPLRCRFALHHMVWFSTSDGGRWKHCSRCGKDWSGSGRPVWNFQSRSNGGPRGF